MLYLSFEEVKATLKGILLALGAPEQYAEAVARVFTENSTDGVYTHGVNRFARLVKNIKNKEVLVNEYAQKVSGLGGYEIWDGNLGFGIVNAEICTKRAIELAQEHGIACVSLRNTNHWLRGGTYGLLVAQAGMLGMMFTNTRKNMVAWGTMEHAVGNNPLVLAVPKADGAHVIADTSFSQYSYGKIQLAKLDGKQLEEPGGYDNDGNMSCDPATVLKSQRILPMAKWKGSSIAMLLDIIAATSSLGNCSAAISRMSGDERAFSQTFIVINPRALVGGGEIESIVDDAVQAVLTAQPVPGQSVRYPGQAMIKIREKNLREGIPVNETVWSEILAL